MKVINLIYKNAKRNIIKVDSHQSLCQSQTLSWCGNWNQLSRRSSRRCIELIYPSPKPLI